MVKNLPANAGDERDVGSIARSGRSPGGGHGNPLQYSWLENPMDRGAWWATAHSIERVGHNWSDLVHTARIPSVVVDLLCLWEELNSETSYTTILKPPPTVSHTWLLELHLKFKAYVKSPPKILLCFLFPYIPLPWKHIISLAWDTIYWLTFYLFGHLSQLLYKIN